MNQIRLQLQQEIFQQIGERLLAVCFVGKLLKKKKSYLCIAATNISPVEISIVQIKQTDKTFKRKRVWPLSDLKIVDGKCEHPITNEFDLHLDKVYRWDASNGHERQIFIITLWKQSNKHFPKHKVIFKNIPKLWITEDIMTPDNKYTTSPMMEIENDLSEDFQAITDKEQEDLNRLMSGCEFAISNAEAFMDVLARDLSLLDGENVKCVLASEVQVEELMAQMELAIEETDKIEKRLDSYDQIFNSVRETMIKMDKKNSMISVANKNNLNLFKALENIISQLDLSKKHQDTLEEPDLTSPNGLIAAIEAGNALRDAMNSQLDPALLHMGAVQEQRKTFEKYKEKFSRLINRHLNNLFIYLGNGTEPEKSADGLSFPSHTYVHKQLTTYTELMHWSKLMDRKAYDSLRKVYTDSFGKLYERDLRNMFDAAKEKVAVTSPLTPTKNSVLLGFDRDQWSLEITTDDRNLFVATLEQVLSLLEPVCSQEQQFCMSFFQLDVLSPTSKNTLTTLDGSECDVNVLPFKKAEKQINEDVRNMMINLFFCLEEELINFLSHIEKQDNFSCMYILVLLNQHVMSAQSSFLSNSFASVLIQVKRSLDRFMQMQIDSIRDCRIPRRSKCGVLPYVFNLEEFTRNAEVLLKSDRRNDLEKWYTRLMDTMIEYISTHSMEHHKTPPQVIKMENYHHLYSLLSQLKISVLDAQRKDAKQKYNEALAAYVTLYFGYPLEKLNTFFEGVQAKVASGVKASEVSYQLAFNKQELRKVINQYPGSTVKRGLEALYKKVEKHLSEEENLLQVVWRAMQEEFIRQYKNLEDLIQQCYPGSMITLEFTINDILTFFSDIARSH